METRSRAWRALSAGPAGALLACADLAASGLARVPGTLVAADLAAGLLAGLVAGGLASACGRAELAGPWVVAGGLVLEGASIASKELDSSGARLLAGVLIGALALAAASLTARAARERRSATWLALVAVPASAWLGARLGTSPWVHAGALWLTPALLLAIRWPRALLACWALAGVALALAQREPGPAPRAPLPAASPAALGPSVVMVLIDTLRADAVPERGALADFARDAVSFRNCISAAPWTLPSVSSILTGLYPSQHGAIDAATPLPEDVTTLAERLRARGYATAAFTGGAFVGPGHRLDQGFERFDPGCERRFPAFGTHLPLVWRLAKNRYLPLRWLLRWVDEYRGLEGGLEAALTWMEEPRDRPVFLLLHTYQVHDYYLYDPDVDDPVRIATSPPGEHFRGRVSVPPSEFAQASQSDLDYFHALYSGRIAVVDQVFGHLRDALSPRVGDDAIWIVSADHGEGFDAARGRVHHGGRLHDDLLRVPLLVSAPGRLPSGIAVADPVRTVDILPTLLDLLEIEVPEALAGASLLPALTETSPYPGIAFAEERAGGAELLMARSRGWKAIRGPGHLECFHVEEDPEERTEVPEVPDFLRAALRDYPVRFPAREQHASEIDAGTLEHLRALGYVR